MRRLLVVAGLALGALGLGACNVPTVGPTCVVYAYNPGGGTGRVLYGGNCIVAYQIAKQTGGSVVEQ
jgi:hypothetical protein